MLEDWCPPFPGFFLDFPSRRQQPAALAALVDSLRWSSRSRTGSGQPPRYTGDEEESP